MLTGRPHAESQGIIDPALLARAAELDDKTTLTHACKAAARSVGCLVRESTMSSAVASSAHSAQQPGHSIRGIRAVNA